MRHCDEYIDDETTPQCLRDFLDYARIPAHGLNRPEDKPGLFAVHEGETVKVNMASRLGDVGISRDLESEYGYFKRVWVSDLSEFAPKAPIPSKESSGTKGNEP